MRVKCREGCGLLFIRKYALALVFGVGFSISMGRVLVITKSANYYQEALPVTSEAMGGSMRRGSVRSGGR